jgi:IclR family acetate operon transcriptional repressor
MAVKPNQSAVRTLAVLETIAEHQPIGITDLAKLLGEDISAVQRALMSLLHAGWICAANGKPTRWELTARIHAVAHMAHGSHDLRHRARPALQALRDQTGETVSLNVVDRGQFIVLDAVESLHFLRVVLTVGMSVTAAGSATGRAILPYMSPERWTEFLAAPPDAAELGEFRATIGRGYSISSSVVVEGYTNIGAPIFEADGRPIGAVIVSGPSERLQDADKVGAMVLATARSLSRGQAPVASVGPDLAVA